MGFGVSFLGGRVQVVVDQNEFACQHWLANQHGTDEQELQLYAHELEAYMDPAMGADKRLAEMHDIVSVKHNNPRFLHPSEAALLLEIPPTTVVPHPARASLAFLGLASPLQLVQVYGHLKSNAGAAAGQLFPSPEEWL